MKSRITSLARRLRRAPAEQCQRAALAVERHEAVKLRGGSKPHASVVERMVKPLLVERNHRLAITIMLDDKRVSERRACATANAPSDVLALYAATRLAQRQRGSDLVDRSHRRQAVDANRQRQRSVPNKAMR